MIYNHINGIILMNINIYFIIIILIINININININIPYYEITFYIELISKSKK